MNELSLLTQFAETASTEASGNILDSLGVDWKLLVIQLVAFLLLVALLAKFVYPVFMKIIDKREADMKASAAAAETAREHAEKAEHEVEKLLAVARKDAQDIVATAKNEATLMVEKSEHSAKAKAEQIVAQAQEDIDKQIIAARKTLESDTLRLVKQAASAATAGVADSKLDDAMIKRSVEGAKR